MDNNKKLSLDIQQKLFDVSELEDGTRILVEEIPYNHCTVDILRSLIEFCKIHPKQKLLCSIVLKYFEEYIPYTYKFNETEENIETCRKLIHVFIKDELNCMWNCSTFVESVFSLTRNSYANDNTVHQREYLECCIAILCKILGTQFMGSKENKKEVNNAKLDSEYAACIYNQLLSLHQCIKLENSSSIDFGLINFVWKGLSKFIIQYKSTLSKTTSIFVLKPIDAIQDTFKSIQNILENLQNKPERRNEELVDLSKVLKFFIHAYYRITLSFSENLREDDISKSIMCLADLANFFYIESKNSDKTSSDTFLQIQYDFMNLVSRLFTSSSIPVEFKSSLVNILKFDISAIDKIHMGNLLLNIAILGVINDKYNGPYLPCVLDCLENTIYQYRILCYVTMKTIRPSFSLNEISNLVTRSLEAFVANVPRSYFKELQLILLDASMHQSLLQDLLCRNLWRIVFCRCNEFASLKMVKLLISCAEKIKCSVVQDKISHLVGFVFPYMKADAQDCCIQKIVHLLDTVLTEGPHVEISSQLSISINILKYMSLACPKSTRIEAEDLIVASVNAGKMAIELMSSNGNLESFLPLLETIFLYFLCISKSNRSNDDHAISIVQLCIFTIENLKSINKASILDNSLLILRQYNEFLVNDHCLQKRTMDSIPLLLQKFPNLQVNASLLVQSLVNIKVPPNDLEATATSFEGIFASLLQAQGWCGLQLSCDTLVVFLQWSTIAEMIKFNNILDEKSINLIKRNVKGRFNQNDYLEKWGDKIFRKLRKMEDNLGAIVRKNKKSIGRASGNSESVKSSLQEIESIMKICKELHNRWNIDHLYDVDEIKLDKIRTAHKLLSNV